MKKLLTIIIPTYDNPQFFNPCISSILGTGITNNNVEILVVNNGNQPISEELAGIENVKVLTPKKNLGWEGALKLALENSDSEFVVFQNDDTFVPPHMSNFYLKLLVPFNDSTVALVAPTTTCAAGIQSIYSPSTPKWYIDVRWAIFFTVGLRRSALVEVGGIDDSLPGGDDFDLSIRLCEAGYKLRVAPDCFLVHHGFKTGERVRGGASSAGGWNSLQMTEEVNHALIRKHGFKTWFTTISQQVLPQVSHPEVDLEGEIIKGLVSGGEILELGCGGKRLFESSTTVDKAPSGDKVNVGTLVTSVADVVADVTKDIPLDEESFDCIIAEHILEHCLDPVATLKLWSTYLKPGGQMILAVPDENVVNSIPMNPEHCHAYDCVSLKNLAELVGLRQTYTTSSGNGVSFVSSFRKEVS